ncbi:MAG: desulfoferrodoxin Dfx [Coriobacteriaceae bacterium]|jgi:superoxide reductase|nr:desulfoferrodoxin Dfx [Coriobacteriaceae bacterium]
MNIIFYRCSHCGNIAIKPFDSGVPLVCCGEAMDALVANTTDAALEKHVPVVTLDGQNVHVEVGSVAHPMTPDHWITFVCLTSEKGYAFAPLAADGQPQADFVLAAGDKPLKVYEYCNLHGLWSAEVSG